MILVSVIIPTYNRIDKLKKAIESVVSQTQASCLEIIVCDDNDAGSDACISVKQVVSSFSDVKYSENIRVKGACGARNTGIMLATGDYIAFLDDDDEWLPEKLVEQISLIERTGAVCIDSGFIEVDCAGNERVILPGLQGQIFEDLLVKDKGRAPKLSTFICRKDALLEVGMFDESLPARQDLDLYLRLARKYEFASVMKPLAINYKHAGDRISNNHGKRIKAFEIFYKKYFDDLRARPVKHRLFIKQYCATLIKAGAFRKAASVVSGYLLGRSHA